LGGAAAGRLFGVPAQPGPLSPEELPEGPLFLPGLPEEVTPEEYLDPGELELDVEPATCRLFLTENFPQGVPPEVYDQEYHPRHFLTDGRRGDASRWIISLRGS